MTSSSLRHTFKRSAIVSGLVAALFAAPALADDAADVSKLMRAGQFSEALTRVDAFLAKNPRDAQMRFMKGVILTEQNKTNEAITVFTRLTEDFPNLPEPYNNLAVLYAAAGQYEKARIALDAAIRTNPSYATAYENLGDVHAKLASQAYDKALQLDSGNSAAKSKLTMVRTLVGADTKVAGAAPAPRPVEPPRAAAAPVSPPAPAPAAPAPSAPAAAAPQPTPPVAAAPAAPAPKPAAKPEPEPKRDTKPAVDDQADDVLRAVQAWARAWSNQDMKGYIGAYRDDFSPSGQSRRAWEEERRARIVGRGAISVKIEAPQISVSGNTATVRFRQLYESGSLNFNTRKTLVLDKQGGKWLIRQESTGH